MQHSVHPGDKPPCLMTKHTRHIVTNLSQCHGVLAGFRSTPPCTLHRAHEGINVRGSEQCGENVQVTVGVRQEQPALPLY